MRPRARDWGYALLIFVVLSVGVAEAVELDEPQRAARIFCGTNTTDITVGTYVEVTDSTVVHDERCDGVEQPVVVGEVKVSSISSVTVTKRAVTPTPDHLFADGRWSIE